DTRPTELTRAFGLTWGVGGWLLTPFLQKIGPAEIGRLRQRVASELKTTFASHYTKVGSLPETLDPANIAVYNKRSTGEKFLINPKRGGWGGGEGSVGFHPCARLVVKHALHGAHRAGRGHREAAGRPCPASSRQPLPMAEVIPTCGVAKRRLCDTRR